MTESADPIAVLIVDDDPEDRDLVREALRERCPAADIRTVSNGEELMDYLRRRVAYAAPGAAPAPSLILLDLNMPRKSGREALTEIKADAALRRIPIVVLTTSQAEEDVTRIYDLGANSFIVKPSRYQTLLDTISTLDRYWFQIVSLPDRR